MSFTKWVNNFLIALWVNPCVAAFYLNLLLLMEDSPPDFFNKRICQLSSDDTFQSWKQHVLLIIRGFSLEGHLFETLAVPQFIADVGGNICKIPSLLSSHSMIALWFLDFSHLFSLKLTYDC